MTRHYLRVRSYPGQALVSVWLCRSDGAAHAGLLWGEVLPKLADEIALATGLPVEREEVAMALESPPVPPGCVPAAQQQTLFPD